MSNDKIETVRQKFNNFVKELIADSDVQIISIGTEVDQYGKEICGRFLVRITNNKLPEPDAVITE